MSSNHQELFIEKFISDVQHAFQQSETKLMSTMNIYRGVGKQFRFPTAESVSAYRNKARGAELIPHDGANSQIPANFQDLRVVAHIEDFDEYRTNVNLMKMELERCKAALMRELDQVIIEALTAGVTKTLSVSNKMDQAAIIAADKQMASKNIPFDNRFLVLSTGGREDILSDPTLTNLNDYGQLAASAYRGENFPVMSFNAITHTGLPASGTDKTWNFGYHKDAVGLALLNDVTTRVDYLPAKDVTQLHIKLYVASTVIRPEGTFKASIDD